MPRPCKICGLPDGLRRAIERDIKVGQLGVTKIVNKYPQAELNEGNIYTHKGHLILSEARDVYDKALREKVEKNKKELEAIAEIDIVESPDKLKNYNQALLQQDKQIDNTLVSPAISSKKSLVNQMATNLVESGTTGNRIMDDVIMLDTIIARGREASVLEQVTPSNVMDAIRLKHSLLAGMVGPESAEKTIEIHMGFLLQKISQENPEITIISEASVEETE